MIDPKTVALIGACGYIAHGILLPKPGPDGIMVCPETGWRYKEIEPEVIRCLDWDEEKPLPVEKTTGTRRYSEFKT
jgi:UDP-2-acetamido-3-amino-2,3-dideoxy-glucuronate N-acetyltransferase